MIVDVLRIAPMINIRRIRRLPIAGNVLVNVGDSVNPEDVITEAFIPGEVVFVDIAKGLGIDPLQTPGCLVRASGDELHEGDILAECDAAFHRIIRTPVDGRFIDCYQGKAVLATGEIRIRLQAGMMGAVQDLIPEYGAVLSTNGSLLQGMWGNGRMGMGVLQVGKNLEELHEKELTANQPEEGRILALPGCADAATLTLLQEMEPSGLILGCLAPALIPLVKQLPFPVIILSGLGDLPVDSLCFNLLRSREGSLASINAGALDRISGVRPEVIIPQTAGEVGEKLDFRTALDIGHQVRIISGLEAGLTGEVVDLPEDKKVFDHGLLLQEAVVKLDDSDTTSLPQQNLVIIN